MKAMLINLTGVLRDDLTLGKVYEVTERTFRHRDGREYYFLQDDVGDFRSLPAYAFEVIPEDEGVVVPDPLRRSLSDEGPADPTSPEHYSRWEIEPIRFIMENDLPFWLGNIIKYTMRYDAKDGLQDLRKARSYLDRKIAEMEEELAKVAAE